MGNWLAVETGCRGASGERTRGWAPFARSLKGIVRKSSSGCGNRDADVESPGVLVCGHPERLPQPVTIATILTPASSPWVVKSGCGDDDGVLDKCSDTDKN